MRLEIKFDEKGRPGFVEKFKKYYYTNNSVSIFCIANLYEQIPEAYVYRADEYIKTSQIDKEIGIYKYIRAKKPFYSLLTNGNIILDLKVVYDDDFNYIKEKTVYTLYIIDPSSIKRGPEKCTVDLIQLLKIDNREKVDAWIDTIANSLVSLNCDRELFLKNRFGV